MQEEDQTVACQLRLSVISWENLQICADPGSINFVQIISLSVKFLSEPENFEVLHQNEWKF